MIKVLTYLISYFAGRYNTILKPSTLMIIDQLLVRARKLVMTSSIIFMSSLLFVAGVIISLIEFTSQVDRFAVVWPSATLAGGLTLAALSMAVLIFSFRAKAFDLRFVRNQRSRRPESLFAAPQGEGSSSNRAQSPLEEALGVLIMDFVNERKQNRERASYQASAASVPGTPQPDHAKSEPLARASDEHSTLQ